MANGQRGKHAGGSNGRSREMQKRRKDDQLILGARFNVFETDLWAINGYWLGHNGVKCKYDFKCPSAAHLETQSKLLRYTKLRYVRKRHSSNQGEEKRKLWSLCFYRSQAWVKHSMHRFLHSLVYFAESMSFCPEILLSILKEKVFVLFFTYTFMHISAIYM